MDGILDLKRETSMNYQILGEVQGKAWRLGHPQALKHEIDRAVEDAVEALPGSEALIASEELLFIEGFWEGVRAVDQDQGEQNNEDHSLQA